MNEEKILYINYMLQKGHVNFDKIHIRALEEAGYDVRLAMPAEYAALLPYQPEKYDAVIPKFLYGRVGSPLFDRIAFLSTLLYLRLRLRFARYKYVFVSNFDEITLGILPLPCRPFLFCHNTANGLKNSIKTSFIHRLAARSEFIVFTEAMAEPFLRSGITNVHVVSHGCVEPFPKQDLIPLPFGVDCRRLIFLPSPGTDSTFLRACLRDRGFISFLEREKILMVVRNAGKDTGSPYVVSIDRYLSAAEYQALFLRADIILIAYPADFGYRVSGVSFECVANGKNILCLAGRGLDYVRSFYDYNPLFSDVSDLMSHLSTFDFSRSGCKVTAGDLRPCYSWLATAGKK